MLAGAATVLLYADAIGLAVFTVIGFQRGFGVTHADGIGIVLLNHLELPLPLVVPAAATTLALRLAALHWNLALPTLWLKESGESKNGNSR